MERDRRDDQNDVDLGGVDLRLYTADEGVRFALPFRFIPVFLRFRSRLEGESLFGLVVVAPFSFSQVKFAGLVAFGAG